MAHGARMTAPRVIESRKNRPRICSFSQAVRVSWSCCQTRLMLSSKKALFSQSGVRSAPVWGRLPRNDAPPLTAGRAVLGAALLLLQAPVGPYQTRAGACCGSALDPGAGPTLMHDAEPRFQSIHLGVDVPDAQCGWIRCATRPRVLAFHLFSAF